MFLEIFRFVCFVSNFNGVVGFWGVLDLGWFVVGGGVRELVFFVGVLFFLLVRELEEIIL